jgi:prevent-host-death family protein
VTVVNMHEAKTHLSQLVERVASGESIIIARSGRPVARLVPLENPPAAQRRLGFLLGQFRIPDDFDRMSDAEIVAAFEDPE